MSFISVSKSKIKVARPLLNAMYRQVRRNSLKKNHYYGVRYSYNLRKLIVNLWF